MTLPLEVKVVLSMMLILGIIVGSVSAVFPAHYFLQNPTVSERLGHFGWGVLTGAGVGGGIGLLVVFIFHVLVPWVNS